MDRIVPIVLAVALFMENMDSTVIATSLPAIAADIGTNPIALKLALTSYYVALAVFIPISGRSSFASRLPSSSSDRLPVRSRARSRISSSPASFKAWAAQ